MVTRRPPSTIDELCVAYLAGQGKTQTQIAQILGLTQSMVSRIYRKRADAYIERMTRFREDKVGPETLEQIRRRVSRHNVEKKLKALAASYGHQGPIVHSIFLTQPSDGARQQGSQDRNAERNKDARQLEMFALDAAPVVYRLLQQVRNTVGVAWGDTLWQIARHLRTLMNRPWRGDSPIEFVPLCGEPLVDLEKAKQYVDRTSSRIAAGLSNTVNGDKPIPMWLGLVPAYIPRRFTEAQRQVINCFIDLVPHYRRIFGPRTRGQEAERPLVENLDMILTAAGSAEHPVGFAKGPLLQLKAGEAQRLKEHIYGDIGGVLIPRSSDLHKNTASGQGLVKELIDLWTGLKMEHLERCAQRALAEGGGLGTRPGVTLLGYRPELAEVICQAVRLGLVNHLIVASPLEAAIEHRLARSTENTPERSRSIIGHFQNHTA